MAELPVMVRGLAVWLLFMKTKFKVWPLPAGWRDPPVPFQCECEGQASATTKDIREGLLEGPLTPLGLGGNQGTGGKVSGKQQSVKVLCAWEQSAE